MMQENLVVENKKGDQFTAIPVYVNKRRISQF